MELSLGLMAGELFFIAWMSAMVVQGLQDIRDELRKLNKRGKGTD